MPDYSKSKIYKLVSNVSDEIYIGSTCQPLYKRKAGHKADYKRYLQGKGRYMTSFKIFEKGDIEIILIEECNFYNKDELHRKEREYIEKIECVNKCIPGRTHKEYCEDNKDKISKISKEYKQNNKEKIKQQLKEYRETNKEKIQQQKKQYNLDNKEKIQQKKKKYRENNKDKIKEKAKAKYQKKKLEKIKNENHSIET